MPKKHISPTQFFLSVLAPALQIQWILGVGFSICILVSIAYLYLQDPRFPMENIWVNLAGLGMSVGSFALGSFLIKHFDIKNHISVRRGAWIVFLTWVLGCTISAIYFMLAGFPDPTNVEAYSWIRRFVDGWYESMSGFTTTGSSILASVEKFPRSVLLWRSMTHWYGGMGIAYLSVTVWKSFAFRREPIINAEAESPNYVEFKKETEAMQSGYDFLKVYSVLTIVLIALLYFSGIFFRTPSHIHWYDNAFEAVNYSMSIMGTGGFGVHDASSGLPVFENGQRIIGGLRNPVSDWICGIFMFFAGMNFGVWYLFLFKRDLKGILKNAEFKWYLIFCVTITVSIWFFLVQYNVYPTIWESLRYSLFNMASIVSTTGLANWDFNNWPAEAQGILFICYLIGGCVGSTAGGPKITRFLVAGRYLWNEIKTLIVGDHYGSFEIDGVVYTRHAAGLVTASMAIYYMIFLFGAIALMVLSHSPVLPDGTHTRLDFTSAIASSIANLGNIGPAVAIGTVNSGPTGNYYAFSTLGKVLMIFLMFIGRVGVLTFLMLFITHRGEAHMRQSVSESRNKELQGPVIAAAA